MESKYPTAQDRALTHPSMECAEPMKEFRSSISDAVSSILHAIPGEDCTRDGLVKTPERVARAMEEMLWGYFANPTGVLGTQFEANYDEVALLKGIRFSSLCEHHLLPFIGTCAIAYIPRDRVVGISKLARLVDVFSHRLQIQERMTVEIASALQTALNPRGVAVIVEARHLCMQCRGVEQPETVFQTSCMLGAFRENQEARNEVLTLLRSS